MAHKTRIMFIECKGEDVVGPARIGRATYSKTNKSIYYRGRTFASLNGVVLKQISSMSRRRSSIGFRVARRMELMRCIRQPLRLMKTSGGVLDKHSGKARVKRNFVL